MTGITSDIVDVYVFRRMNARVQFLLLQRKPDVPLGNTWQSFHTQIGSQETALTGGIRAVRDLAGLHVSTMYSADYVNEFYDDTRDLIVLAPVLAVNVNPQSPIFLGADFRDWAWLDRDDATARLPFSGQRWAVRHIDEIMSIGAAESELYRLQMPVRASEGTDTSSATASAAADGDAESEPLTGGATEADESTPALLDETSTDVRNDDPEKVYS